MRKRMVMMSCLLILVAACASSKEKLKEPIKDTETNAKLAEHGKIFKKGVEKVTSNIYVAVGFGLANSIMIEGTDGLIIIDTMESKEAGLEVMAEFRKITPKPVKAIIYTHNHADHVLGTEAFIEDGHTPAIYAHETTDYHVNRVINQMRPIIGTRSMRMFGSFLDEKKMVNAGIGPFLKINPGSTSSYLPPTKTFSDLLEDEVAGIKFQLHHAPGETDDQLFVWLPHQRVLLCGDNFYWAFPNLYTIRGTPFRSLQQWCQSLDKIRDLQPEYLVPSHTRPLKGADTIAKILTDYRDAIQFLHDQSVRGMNMGLTPDELTEYVQLPGHLAKAPYLQPFYGKVSWSVRSMFAGNLGWFDGDSASLQPLTRKEQARLMARLAGGEPELLRQAKEALENGEYQVALQLTSHLAQLNPESQPAKEIRVQALLSLGEREENPNARHWYLTEALEIRDGFIAREAMKPSSKILERLPLKGFFEILAVSLDAKASMKVNKRVGIKFRDRGEAYSLHVRHGVAEFRPQSPEEFNRTDYDIKVVADSQIWKEMLARVRHPLTTLPTFDYKKGNFLALAQFLKLFTLPEQKLPYQPFSG